MVNKKIKILAIDDNRDNLITLKAIISEALPQSVVYLEDSGQGGIESAMNNDPDVILLDIVMPGKDGYQVCKILKADELLSETPVIFVTALKGDKQSRILALEAGGDAFLAKPIDSSELKAQINAMLKIKEAAKYKRNEKTHLEELVQKRTEELRKANIATLNLLEDLNAEKEKLKLLNRAVEASSVSVVITDAQGHINYVNPYFTELTGYSYEEAIGKNPRFLKSGHQPKAFYEGLWNTILSGKDWTGEFRNIKKNGEYYWEKAVISPLINSDGVFTNFVAIKEDVTDRKKAETDLRKFMFGIENSSDAVFITDLSGIIEYINHAFVEIYGYHKSEVLGKTPRILKSGTIPLEVYKQMWDMLLAGKQLKGEIQNKTRDGRILNIEGSNNPILDDNGKIIGFLSINRDISERKKAEEKLKLLNRAVEASSVSVVITDAEGHINYINPYFTKLTGYSSDEILGRKLRILNPGKLSEADSDELWRTILSGIDWKGEYQNRKKNGEFYWENAVITPILSSNGKVINIVAIKEDITERKKILEELVEAKEKAEESEIQIKYSQEVARIGYYDFNVQTGFWSSSEMLDKIFGIDISYIRDVQGWLSIIHPDFQQEMQNYLLVNILKNRETFNKSYQIINQKTKLACWVHGLGTLEFDNSGNLLKMFGTIQDISISKNFEKELIKAKEKAEESDRLKSAFLSNMSHEIRTPMNGILGFTDLLLTPDLSSEEKERYIKIVHQSGKRMLNTVTDIIEISKIEAGLVNVTAKETDFNERIEELFYFFRAEAENKGLKIILEQLLPVEEKNISTDINKLDSILTNLIKNAIKYTLTGTIKIGCQSKGNFVEFYIKDTGIGIPVDRQEAIFERFMQADVADAKVFEGSGLGLAIAKSYVEMLGGKIWVESEEGLGSTFYFTLPLTDFAKGKPVVSNEIPVDKENNTVKSAAGPLKIIIAEDDEYSFFLLKTILSEYGITQIHARNGEEAIMAVKNNPDIALILMDIKMPVLNGLEATQKIRQFNKTVPIIAQTAYAFSSDKKNAIEAGCNDYISKPILKEKLLAIIRKYVE